MKKLKCQMCGKVFSEQAINDIIAANKHGQFERCRSPEAGTRPLVDSGIGGHLLREIEELPRCKSCGVTFAKHPGVQWTCTMLSEAVAVINLLLGAEAVVQRDEEILDNRRRREFARSFLEKLERERLKAEL